MVAKTFHVASLLLIVSGLKDNYFNCGQEFYEQIYYQCFPNLIELDEDFGKLKDLFSTLNFEIEEVSMLAAYFLSLSGKTYF